MVHGINYGIQYAIHLNKSIDLYDDLLPICSTVRKMLTLNKENNIITILSLSELKNRFDEIPESTIYSKALNIIEFESNSNLRITNSALYVYHDTYAYSIYSKNIVSFFTPLEI